MWIEIGEVGVDASGNCVTPFAGVWIEILTDLNLDAAGMSHPSRVCGLKSPDALPRSDAPVVTPFAGVWIEIYYDIMQFYPGGLGHTLRGCVD